MLEETLRPPVGVSPQATGASDENAPWTWSRTGGRDLKRGSRRPEHLVRLSERFRSVITSGGRAWRVTRAAKGI